MRRRFWLPLLLLLVTAAPAAAAEPKCPLELSVCLNQYEKMKHRPWLGVSVERDSTGHVVVRSVRPDGPARHAGLKAGDVLESIEGLEPGEWFATKAGWKTGDHGAVALVRGGHEKRLELPYEAIPEEVFAKIVGTHMIEGHLAYMHDETTESSPR